MNIDVREYLRINPISVHELSLSDNGNDCFLLFPSTSTQRGYKAFTQTQLFHVIQKSIFGNLLDFSGRRPTIKPFDPEHIIEISPGQFKNYVRRADAEDFMYGNPDKEIVGFDTKLKQLSDDLDDIILALRRKGILKYKGAVELQSNSTRRTAWDVPAVLGVTIETPMYHSMSYAEGQIWCRSTGSTINNTGGEDEVEVGDDPLFHFHVETKAETLTGPLAKNFGGGQLVGDFAIGSKELLSQNTEYGPTRGAKVSPIEQAEQQVQYLTYPLWGQNVLDWRNPKKEHNNVPPCLNIYVRYRTNDLLYSTPTMESCEEMFRKMAMVRESMEKVTESVAEAQYESSMVCELPDYTKENLTAHDYVLRLALQADGQVKMMRQSIQMLLDIFATRTNEELSTEDSTMWELLKKHLDAILMPVSEFMSWYIEKTRQLDEIEAKIETAKQLVVSVPPLNYIGRIIVSYTDDTEQKVIANYGGKSWRRIENFLRGTTDDNPDYIPGRKWGEDFVALRESNVPIHSHSETITDVSETGPQEWTTKDKSGSTRLVNTPQVLDDTKQTIGVKNVALDYQISPLEYSPKEENDITLPHDNLPPYLKVYIWECTELTDEERKITNEPDGADSWTITFLKNDGTSSKTQYTRENEQQIGNAPTVSWSGHDFAGWKCPDGSIRDKKQNNQVGQPVFIDDLALGNSFYVAQWKSKKYTVTFDSNGGTPETMSRTYDEGQKIGYFPTMDTMPDDAESLNGWFTAKTGGKKVNADTKVTESTTYYAHWKKKQVEKCTVSFFKHDGETEIEERTVDKGSRIGTLPVPSYTWAGHTFKGWFTKIDGGVQISETKVVDNDLNLYARWSANTYVVTWNPNFTGATTEKWTREFGVEIGTLPVAYRAGYVQNGWWTEDGITQVTSRTTVQGNITYYAHWNKTQYSISYDLRGGNMKTGETNPVKYTVTDTITLYNPIKEGNNFLGWTGSNGSTPQMAVTIPVGSTGDRFYDAT